MAAVSLAALGLSLFLFHPHDKWEVGWRFFNVAAVAALVSAVALIVAVIAPRALLYREMPIGSKL